uniref:B30.2/SPRY domain-containing protein n=1 Tax=Sander lucioperca TaxID=283035 RepID=A0A8C9XS39_SANLU
MVKQISPRVACHPPHFLMGGPNSLGRQSRERGGNLAPYELIKGRFQIGPSELSFSQRQSRIPRARFTPITISSHWGTIGRLGELILMLKNLIKGLNELIDTIKEKQKTTEKQAEAFIKELEQEISELMKRRTEEEQLSRSEDHLHLLQSVQSLKTNHPPPTKDWTEVSIRPSSYEGTVVKAVAQLEEMLSKEMKKLLAEPELKRVQQYAVDVTLDPDTAHPNLILSHDRKQVRTGKVKKNLPNNPERFSLIPCVLGKQSFSSGRFYFEVQVKGKTEWDLGVARESINRKENIPLNPEDGYWTIWMINGNEYEALDDPGVLLSLKSPPQKVGVFVDYEEGLVSFYDVDAAALIYSFTGCSFTEKLFLYLWPGNNEDGKNSAPLIISPVRVN